MYYCLNFTTDKKGPGAVLIRAIEPLGGIEIMKQRRGTNDIKKLASGPGRLSQAFAIDLQFNKQAIGSVINLREREYTPHIAASPRVGITKAAELEWRFFESGNPFVSRAKLIKSSQL
jgi:DNA-3-methyladenine glycosylase